MEKLRSHSVIIGAWLGHKRKKWKKCSAISIGKQVLVESISNRPHSDSVCIAEKILFFLRFDINYLI